MIASLERPVVNDNRTAAPSVLPRAGGYQGVDSSHNARLRFEIPQNFSVIQRALLSFSLQAWRASQQSTSAAGSAHSHGVPSESVGGATSTSVAHQHATTWNAGSPAITAGFSASGGGGSPVVNDSVASVAHTNTDGSHSHSISGQSTAGTTSNSEASHTHSLNAPTGLTDQAMAQGVHVLIAPAGGSFTDYTSALGGPWGVGSALDVNDLDISAYITAGGWWEVQLSSTTLGGVISNVDLFGLVSSL